MVCSDCGFPPSLHAFFLLAGWFVLIKEATKMEEPEEDGMVFLPGDFEDEYKEDDEDAETEKHP